VINDFVVLVVQILHTKITMSNFEAFREEVTGWIRPGHDHGCPPVEVIPGLWTAHYDEIDSLEKLQEATNFAPLALVVNSAVCQCASRDGFYGPDIKVLEVDIEDDPDERKYFDQGKKAVQSRCRETGILSKHRCAGDFTVFFDPVSDEIHSVLQTGKSVLVHCKASLSRSPALILAYLMKYHNMSLMEAGRLLKSKWDATWPCDRFSYDLVIYERELAKNK
jgi:Dual specificity phosphatase, catalytic domain